MSRNLNISGGIPASWRGMISLEALLLQRNNLSGPPPLEPTRLPPNLQVLALSCQNVSRKFLDTVLPCPNSFSTNGASILQIVSTLKELQFIDMQDRSALQSFPLYWSGAAADDAVFLVEVTGIYITLRILALFVLVYVFAEFLYKKRRISRSAARLLSWLDYRGGETRSAFVGGVVSFGLTVGILLFVVTTWSFCFASQEEVASSPTTTPLDQSLPLALL